MVLKISKTSVSLNPAKDVAWLNNNRGPIAVPGTLTQQSWLAIGVLVVLVVP